MALKIAPGAVDGCQRFWDPSARAYDLLSGGQSGLDRLFLPEHLAPLLEASGIERTILVQAHSSDEESDWLLEVADGAPFVAGVVAWLDLASPHAPARLKRLARHPKLKGVRYDLEREPANDWLLGDAVQPALRALAERELALDLPMSTRHLRWLPEAAQRHPRLRFVIEHMARPRIAAGQTEPWGTMMRAAADCPNVWCKVSGFLTPDVGVRAQTARLRLYHGAPRADVRLRAPGVRQRLAFKRPNRPLRPSVRGGNRGYRPRRRRPITPLYGRRSRRMLPPGLARLAPGRRRVALPSGAIIIRGHNAGALRALRLWRNACASTADAPD